MITRKLNIVSTLSNANVLGFFHSVCSIFDSMGLNFVEAVSKVRKNVFVLLSPELIM